MGFEYLFKKTKNTVLISRSMKCSQIFLFLEKSITIFFKKSMIFQELGCFPVGLSSSNLHLDESVVEGWFTLFPPFFKYSARQF
jgi:hypothetical protein